MNLAIEWVTEDGTGFTAAGVLLWVGVWAIILVVAIIIKKVTE